MVVAELGRSAGIASLAFGRSCHVAAELGTTLLTPAPSRHSPTPQLKSSRTIAAASGDASRKGQSSREAREAPERRSGGARASHDRQGTP